MAGVKSYCKLGLGAGWGEKIYFLMKISEYEAETEIQSLFKGMMNFVICATSLPMPYWT